ncbi:MAG TPA: tyrosine/phenylalanine carboxypeptidase domain-containing protein [Candidatus Dojkabacteria bacterium]|jgi:hypothetical protein
MSESDKFYKELDKFIGQVQKHIKIISSISPINFLEEKDKFFVSNFNYNPQFKYKKAEIPDFEFEKYLKMSEEFNSIDPVGSLYLDKILQQKNQLKLLKNIGSSKFSDYSTLIFPFDNKALTSAEKEINKPKQTNISTKIILNAEEIYYKLKKELEIRRLSTQVIISQKDHLNRMYVDYVDNKIIIPSNIKKTEEQLTGTIAHEIDVHLTRAENGIKQKAKIFYYGTAGYLPDEEGLAIHETLKVKNNKSIRRYALLYLAISKSCDLSFEELFQFLWNKTKKKNFSFNMTYRVKRGLSDTSKPGGFTKDQYFAWYLSLKDKLEKKPYLYYNAFLAKATLEEINEFLH